MRRLSVTLLLLLIACAGGGERVTLLHTNDSYNIVSGADGSGGAARLATVVNRLRAEHPDALLIHGGDFISPDLMSGVFYGRQMIDMMNRVAYDLVTFGNHEFDFGPDVLNRRIGESNFPWLVSNLTLDGAPWPGSHQGRVVEINGRRIGFFGLLTPDTVTLARLPEGVVVGDPVTAGKGEAVRLKQEGAEAVVAITHLAWAEDRRLALGVKEIDLILGGHDHEKKIETAGGRLIVKAGDDWKWVAVIQFAPGGPVSVDYVPVDAAVVEEPTVKEGVDQWNARLDSALGEVVGQSGVVLDVREGEARQRETNAADLICDAVRERLDADIAIMNGGLFRSGTTYGPGDITLKDIASILPFGNIAVSTRLTGAAILAALENGFSQYEDIAGRFPQVAGMTVTADISRPAGSRVVAVRVGEAPLDPAAVYLVATNDYLLAGGDGYTALTTGEVVVGEAFGDLLTRAVAEYIERHSPVAPTVEGRVVLLR